MSGNTLNICFIVPPQIVDSISEHGNDVQRERIAETAEASDQIRTERAALTLAPIPATGPAKNRNVHDAQHGYLLPGQVIRAEGNAASGDAAVDEAYDGTGSTYDLFLDEYSRNSMDDNGMDLVSSVHYRVGYDNAFWNGQQMAYGDGDEDLPEADRIFNRFTVLDITGHEMAHGVIQHTAGLAYQDQPGALNESFADVFGSLVKQKVRSQTADQADWIIGEGLFTPNVNGVGIRSLKAPGTAYDDPVLGKDPQPAHMVDYVNTTSDNGGVHINSGIPNHAFYLAAVALGGTAYDKAGRIWYKTLSEKLDSQSQFQQAAQATVDSAGELFGDGSTEQRAVCDAWGNVGIQVVCPDEQPTPEPVPPEPEPEPEPDTNWCRRVLNRILGR